MTSVLAVYENGVLRPKEPLDLKEGETVSITVAPLPLSVEEWDRRIRSAKTIQEWVELANACPNPDPDYDVVKEMNKTRRANGERLLTIEDDDGPAPPNGSIRPPTSDEEDFARRLREAKTAEEMFALMNSNSISDFPVGYDLCKALNDNRRATGERLLFPEANDGCNP